MKATTVTTVNVQMEKDEHENLVKFLRDYRQLIRTEGVVAGKVSEKYRNDIDQMIADLTGTVTRGMADVGPRTTQIPAIDPRARTDEIPAVRSR